MTDLRARIQSAEVGSAELDAEIIRAVLAPEGSTIMQSPINFAFCIYHGLDHAGRPRIWDKPFPYRRANFGPSQSVDAALALVAEKLPEAAWMVQASVKPATAANAIIYELGKDRVQAWAKTPALALVCALLPALEIG